jgi:signal transduction histidine kinase
MGDRGSDRIEIQESRINVVEPRADGDSMFRELLEDFGAGIRVDDARSRRIVYVNPAYASLWSLSRETLTCDASAWLGAVHAADRADVYQAWSKLDVGATFALSYRLVQPDGGVRCVNERILPVSDSAGCVTRRIGVVADAQNGDALDRSREPFHDDRLASLGTLASGIVHELSNPLATILLLAGNGLDSAMTPDDQRTVLSRIGDEAKRCGDIVKSVLTLAREDALEKQLADLNASVRQAATLLEHRFRDCGAVLQLDLQADLPTLVLNQTAIQQAVVNILKNACEAGAHRVRVATEATAGGARVVVDDDGIGASEASRNRMFEPFYTTRSDRGGSGLGLTLARRIVTAHAGAIRVEPRPGGGTRMIVELPSDAGVASSD